MNSLRLLVAAETVVLGLLALVVLGLLRSHAEILRRLPEDKSTREQPDVMPPRSEPARPNEVGIPDHLPAPRARGTEVADIEGTTLDGASIVLSPARTDTLLAFLSSGCLTCRPLWEGLRGNPLPDLPRDARLIVVVKDRDRESPSRLADLAPPDLPVVMSSQAWTRYGVQMSPYFLFVSGESGTVRSEGSAGSWEQVRSLLRDAIADEELLANGSIHGR